MEPLDPFTYVGRILTRAGDKIILEVGGDTSSFKLKDGDEFVTLTTVTELFPEES